MAAQAFVNPYNFVVQSGGGGNNGNGANINRTYSSQYAMNVYDMNMQSVQTAINNDSSLNLITKDQLLSDISTGATATQNAGTNNADTYDQITGYYLNQVQSAMNAAAQSAFQTQQAAQDAQVNALPGRSETVLTSRPSSTPGSPTLLTGK